MTGHRHRHTERAAAEIVKTILNVVQVCHQHGVMHRDLKPENFLFSGKDENETLKAIDFGLSVFFEQGQCFNEIVGSPYYMAPEVLRRNYGLKADIRSAGVILYILLCGVPPFWAETEEGITHAIVRGVIFKGIPLFPILLNKVMMGTDLQQLLRNLCLNTEWNYVVFWKLKHHPRMVLAWEDAFYHKHAKHDPCGSRCHEGIQSLHEGSFSQDPLGLAVAKMAYHVYSLGEGIVGQVAVTGKHHWILADEHPANSLLSPEQCDGWQAQFLAGVQTLVVAAVLPHGVVQLGSMNKVTEDSKLIAHLRDVFSTFEESSASPVSNAMLHSLQMLMNMSDAPTNPVVLHGCPVNLCKGTDGENLSLPLQNQVESCHEVMLPAHQMQTVRLVTNNKPVPSISKDGGSASVVQSHFKQESKELTYEDSFERTSSYDAALLDNKPGAEGIHFPSHLLGSSIHDRYLPGYSSLSSQALLEADEQLQRNLGKSTVLDLESNSLGRLDSTSKLSSGYELHEALGPAFVKQNYPLWWDLKNSNPQATSALGEGMEHSMLTSETGTDHLLDAVVANFCSKEHQDLEGMNSLSASAANSLLTTEKTIHETSIDTTSHTVGSLCYSTDYSSLPEDSSEHRMTTSSGSYSVKSSKAFSSPGTSMSKEQFLPPSELLKSNKKRAKPGENSRPRPRDRQLIQDRIKELRELVPNGSKCSIDSLLERTIKHMLYLQSVTKHADKLGNWARSRANKDMGSSLGRSSCDQGASWAVEVGGHMKICPIVVENLNMNGQMLIEMLCEDCSYFLEIAEAIRGLGLIILKGETESHGDKTWMRFVVESQNNRNMHRMDVLWSLVQILQTKAAT